MSSNIGGHSLRHSTIQKSDLCKGKPFEPSARAVLPSGKTPSITNSESGVNAEISAIKAAHRVHCFFIQRLVEHEFELCLKRGKTSLQGTSASKGWQACHGCLAPTTTDTKMSTVVPYIIKNGSTPTKTTPFLQSRMGLNNEDIQLLNKRHKDDAFVKNFLQSHLPKNGMHSVLEGTYFHWNCNATFENPDDSNHYDSALERAIAPHLEKIHQNASAEEATEALVTWLVDYYKTSIKNLENQIDHLNLLSDNLNRMSQFEKAYASQEEIPNDEFEAYVEDVSSFLKHHKAVLEKKTGCPSLKKLNFIRNDMTFLTKLSTIASDKEKSAIYFKKNTRHLQENQRTLHLANSPMNLKDFEQKCTFHSQEAHAQLEGIQVFEEPCTIPDLTKMHFGIMENGARRVPNATELSGQLHSLLKLASPVKQKVTETNKARLTGVKRALFQESSDTALSSPKKRKLK
jgi:hypothetical protein